MVFATRSYSICSNNVGRRNDFSLNVIQEVIIVKSKKLYWMETVVCSARKGVDARLERMLEARQEMRRRCEGCIRAWVSRSIDNQPMFLLQAIYESEDAWRESSKKVSEELDSRDGGIETLLGGPPLVGIFGLDPKNLNLKGH
ncbi:MAG: hypothetical protein DWC02_07165 [Candidatus Poseidoniales archaeon]|nr:MAG: hypothetical protein DWC02_07165 [Candidatus Poseidoniales archaeon]